MKYTFSAFVKNKNDKRVRYSAPVAGQVHGTLHDCDARCIYAVSDSCHCRCIGTNHGSGFNAKGEKMTEEWVKTNLQVDLAEDKKKVVKSKKPSMKELQAQVDKARVELKKPTTTPVVKVKSVA